MLPYAFPQNFRRQLHAYQPWPLLDQGYMSDQALGGQLYRRWEYLQLVVHQVNYLLVHH